MSRMRVSETGLSTTTTSSGLFDEARTSPQVPSSHRHAHAVDEIADRLAGDLLALRLGGLEMRHDLVDDDGLR